MTDKAIAAYRQCGFRLMRELILRKTGGGKSYETMSMLGYRGGRVRRG